MKGRFALTKKHYAIGFLVALLGILMIGVAWLHFSHVPLSGRTVLLALTWFSVLAGTTVTYINPTATTPTALVMLPLSRVVAIVAFADADTTALITHNMNIPLASTPTQHGQNSGNPWITWILAASSAGTLPAVLAFTRGTNTLTIAKITTTVGTNCTIEVTIERYEPVL